MTAHFRCKCQEPCDQTGHGSWTYLVDLGTDLITGKRKQLRRSGFATRAEAEIAEAEHKRTMSEHQGYEGWKSNQYYAHATELLDHDIKALVLEDGPGDVYVFLAGRYLKIGYTTHVDVREYELRGRNHRSNRPFEADVVNGRMIATHPGSREAERQLLHFCRNFWVRGEWYVAHPRLITALYKALTPGRETA